MNDAVIQGGLLDAGHQKLHRRESHRLRMDVDCGQRGAAVAGLSRIIKAAHQDILRHGNAAFGEDLHGVERDKIIGAEKRVRQLRQCRKLFAQVAGFVRLDQKEILHRNAGHEHGPTEGGVALEEGLAVFIVPDEAQTSEAALEHLVHEENDPRSVVHV